MSIVLLVNENFYSFLLTPFTAFSMLLPTIGTVR